MVAGPMGRGTRVALALGLAGTVAGLLALGIALERDAPLFLNLGAGDAPFARGFRGGWERDGLSGAGETQFHWTEDGSRLEFPVAVTGGAVKARMRVARFAAGTAEIRLLAGTREVERWSQPSRGWEVRESALGAVQGPFMLRFRSEAPGGEALGVALDWVEIQGAESVVPTPRLAAGLALLLVGVPLAAAWFGGAWLGLGVGAVAAWAAAAAVFLDRLGGLVGASEAGGPALAAVTVVGLAHRVLRRKWPEQLEPRTALAVPFAGVVLACVGLFHPSFHYPDVDTHARFLDAIRVDLWTAFDPSDYQEKVGAWTRTIAGRKVAFPYAPFFHLAAWPLALVFGSVGAVKATAVTSLGLTLVLAFALARGLGTETRWAALAQALLLVFPVTTSRLTLALFPALLGQAMEALLGVHLLRRFGHLDGARDAAAATFFLFAAQLAYTGSLYNVGAVVLLFAALETAAGERRRALRLVTSYAVAAAAVVLLLYARFLPTLVKDVLPHARDSAEPSASLAAGAWMRLATFYDGLLPLLALAGLALATAAPVHARRYVTAAFAAGLLVLVLRAVLPAAFRDAKDVELLAVPMAALTAVTLRRLWGVSAWGRLGVLLLLLGVLAFCLPRAVAQYAARFVAVGRSG
jgi:hypothetical protein